MKRLILITFLATLSSATFAADVVVDVQNKSYWMCKNQKDVRTMRIEVDKVGICRAFYSKAGVEKSIGSGKNFESCVTFVQSVKTNLEKSGWACRDITSTTITSLTE